MTSSEKRDIQKNTGICQSDHGQYKMKNRIANTKNPFQGDRTKTLCVCSAGLLRSPTLAAVLLEKPWNRNTRAVGASTEFALIPIDEALVEWADEIIFVEPRVRDAVVMGFGALMDKRVFTLDIPDKFETFEPELIKLIIKELAAKGVPQEIK